MNSRLKTGDIITANKKQYTLGERIGSGAEGTVFRLLEIKDFAVKILRTSNDPEKDNRKRLILNRLIAKDIDLDKTHLFMPRVSLDYPNLGYIMPYYSDSLSLTEYLAFDAKKDFVETYLKGTFGFKKRLRTAAILFDALHNIHLSGMTFVDISPNNILVSKEKWGIAFIDTDNLVVGNYEMPEVLGTPRYIAPEVLNQTDSATQESDIFSMAEIVFELLTFYHPFIGEDIMESTPEEEQEAYKGNRDYLLAENSKAIMKNTICADVFLSNKLRDLFNSTFVDGLHNKFIRPTAREFADELKQIYNELITCQNDNCRIDYPFFYGAKCPNCDTHNSAYSVNYMMKTIEKDNVKSDSIISRKIITIETNSETTDKKANSTNLYFFDFMISDIQLAFANIKIMPELKRAQFSFKLKMLPQVEIIDRGTQTIYYENKPFEYDFTKKDLIILKESYELTVGKRELIYYVRVKQEF